MHQARAPQQLARGVTLITATSSCSWLSSLHQSGENMSILDAAQHKYFHMEHEGTLVPTVGISHVAFLSIKHTKHSNSGCQGMYNRSHRAIAVAMECQGVLACLYYVLLHYCTSWLAINGSPGTLDTFILMFILCSFLYSEASY